MGCHFLLWNNAVTEIKITLEGTNSRITEAEDGISEVGDRMVEISEAERKKEKKIKRNEDNLRDLWDNIKCLNIQKTKIMPSDPITSYQIVWETMETVRDFI